MNNPREKQQPLHEPPPPERNRQFNPALEIPIHLVYWPLYLPSVFLLQVFYRVFTHVGRHLRTNGLRMVGIYGRMLADFVRWAWLCREPKRLGLLLRASFIYTPSSFLDVMSGEPAMKENPNVARSDDRVLSGQLREAVFERDGRACVVCRRHESEVTLDPDHVIPVSRGGADSMANLRTLCRECHQARHARFF